MALAFFVYLLECSDKTYYCGWTKNIELRVKTHNLGKASKYTRSRLPVKLVFFEQKKSKSLALKREKKIKKMTRKEKQRLVVFHKFLDK